MRLISLFLLITLITSGYSQKFNYSISSISPDLKKDANAVLREYSLNFEVIDEKNAVMHSKKVVSILNANGKNHGLVDLHYDRFRDIGRVKLKIYDKNGKLLKKVPKSIFRDIPAISNFSLYEDSRVLLYYPGYVSYPYTIELEYDVKFKSILNTPIWKPRYAGDLAVEKSEFIIRYPRNQKLKYKVKNIENHAETSLDGAEGIYTSKWKVMNLNSANFYQNNGITNNLPIVYTSPEKINLEGNKFTNKSWSNFGQWFHNLNEGRDLLSSKAIDKIKLLTDSTENKSNKIKLIYNYLQENTRYVNISLGIGGYQTFPANVVDEVGYGDCKALTTYTKAMLKSVNIESNYVLIDAGKDNYQFEADFPSNQFNHVILAVPLEKDTIWLECTSQQIPFGFLGTFTNDRFGLLIKNGESQLIKTPRYGKNENKEIRKLEISLNDEGDAEIDLEIIFTGLRTEVNGLNWIIHETRKDQETWINQYLNIADIEVIDFNFKTIETAKITLNAKVKVREMAQSNQHDLVFQLSNIIQSESTFNSFNKSIEKGYEYISIDSINLAYGRNLYSGLKTNKNIESNFGSYDLSISPNPEGNLIIRRKFLSRKHKFDANSKSDFRSFLKEVIRSDQNPIIIKKKT